MSVLIYKNNKNIIMMMMMMTTMMVHLQCSDLVRGFLN